MDGRDESRRSAMPKAGAMIIATAYGDVTPHGLQGAGLVDINRASILRLRSLSGIGPCYAERIVAGRPYHATEELQHVLPLFIYNRLKHRIMVEHQGW